MPTHVSSIFVYPVKSLGTIATDSAAVEHRGLRHDRRWMLVRPDGLAVTQRDCPKLLRSSQVGYFSTSVAVAAS